MFWLIRVRFLNSRRFPLKTLLTFAICLAVATPTLCQSTSAAKDQEEREQQLRMALEQIRDAIDHYHGLATRGRFEVPVGSLNYPVDLETLVKGVVDTHGKTIKFLRKVPLDPMTGTTDWGLKRASSGQVTQGGVVEVYTKSDARALDGTKYQDW